LIKFKEIESAAAAAASNEVILDNPKIKIVYTVFESNEESSSPVKDHSKREDSNVSTSTVP